MGHDKKHNAFISFAIGHLGHQRINHLFPLQPVYSKETFQEDEPPHPKAEIRDSWWTMIRRYLLAKLTFRVAKHGELNPRLAFSKLCIAIKGVKKIIVKSLTRYFFILTDTASKVCEQIYTEIKEGCIRGVGAYKRHVSCQNAIPQGTYSISKAKRWELKTPWKEESYSLHPGDGS